ncbi:FadR family transcriptional regulator [Anaerotruncus sp. AF02-27]|uniref:FadR/GntR family transcriptional regulator n=1 Tax=Anaerotruncus TaxID=244127 RepID=UPI000E5171A8|nr:MULTISPECIES: GntR family transcriptional regulator [Anaerotruncus]RGX54816.1 FadR family transcriptional regulator [Anaerotruncus sp. AF02-27]
MENKAYEKVILHIKGRILEGSLRQGEKLPPERELAEQLGVGRNSVREALRTLEIIGVISSTQGAGNFVSASFEKSLVELMTMMFLLQKTDYRQISELRQGIETQAALLALERIDAPTVTRLSEIAGALGAGGSEERNVVLDKQLHYTIAQTSGNQLIVEILQALSDVMDLFISDLRREILTSDLSRDQLQHSHEGMVRGLLLRDRQILLQAIGEHFRLITEHL